MGDRYKVAKTNDIQPGTGIVAEAGDREVAVFNVDGTFYAIDNECKHRGGPLGEGELDGTVVECPLHAWCYDVTSGECHDDPSAHVDRFEVHVEGDDVFVEV